jgi:hypothetical protein
MNFRQRVRAEAAWMEKAKEWAAGHPGAGPDELIDAVENPARLLVRPLAGAAIFAAARERESG